MDHKQIIVTNQLYHNCGLGTYPLDVDDDLLFQNYVASDQIL